MEKRKVVVFFQNGSNVEVDVVKGKDMVKICEKVHKNEDRYLKTAKEEYNKNVVRKEKNIEKRKLLKSKPVSIKFSPCA